MYPDRFRLPFLSGVLIAAAERRRPGLGPWSPQVEAQLRQAFESELHDVRTSFLESFDDPAWFARIEEKIQEIALPRYLVEAKRETDLEQRQAEALVAEKKAHAQGVRKHNEALAGSGGTALVKLKIAESLAGKDLVILPGGKSGVGLQTLNVNQLLQAITARQAAQSVPAQESKQ